MSAVLSTLNRLVAPKAAQAASYMMVGSRFMGRTLSTSAKTASPIVKKAIAAAAVTAAAVTAAAVTAVAVTASAETASAVTVVKMRIEKKGCDEEHRKYCQPCQEAEKYKNKLAVTWEQDPKDVHAIHYCHHMCKPCHAAVENEVDRMNHESCKAISEAGGICPYGGED